MIIVAEPDFSVQSIVNRVLQLATVLHWLLLLLIKVAEPDYVVPGNVVSVSLCVTNRLYT